MRRTCTSASIWAHTRDTVDLEIPESQPSAFTKSSTFLVEVTVLYTVMITAHNARSILRRGSNNSPESVEHRTPNR